MPATVSLLTTSAILVPNIRYGMVLALAGDGACAAAGDAGDWVLRLGFRRAQAKRPQDGSCAGNDAGLSDGLAGAIIAQRAETQNWARDLPTQKEILP